VQPSKEIPLGPALIVYRDRPLGWRDLFVLFLPSSLAVFAPLVYGLKRDLYARTYYGPVAAQAWSWPWYLLAALSLIPLVLLALRRVRQAHRWVMLHKNGLKIQWNKKAHMLLWNQIEGLACSTTETTFLGQILKTRQRLTLFPTRGNLIHIDERLKDLSDLAERIKAKLHPHLLPKMRSAFNNGETLRFGPIRVHKQAIHVREQAIPWEQVSRLNVSSGKLVINSASKFALRIPVGKIPNIELLIQILQEGVNP
jgi:hypothetical protein